VNIGSFIPKSCKVVFAGLSSYKKTMEV